MLVLFALTLFLSSALLFLVQPMFAKMVLPLLGGSPSVWNTCLVFFQATLLAGYLYAHASTRWLGVRRQAVMHVAVLLLPFIALPIGIASGWRPPVTMSPVPSLLGLLLISVGLPFFVVATSAPLLQRWFASTRHSAAKDPYFLYRASNVGSIAGLLAYPFVLEPTMRLADQSWFWTTGYALLAVLIAACAGMVWRTGAAGSMESTSIGAEGPLRPEIPEIITVPRRLRWIALAFVPSSLMLGVTTFLSTDIAAIPLLWIIPLLIYLLTFVLAFGTNTFLPRALTARLFPLALLPLVILILLQVVGPLLMLIPLHLLVFFLASMMCHGELGRDRPSPRHLTEFYLWMSLGGVIGGLFNAVVAPVAFRGVVEYPLAMIIACLLRPGPSRDGQRQGWTWRDVGVPAALAVVLIGAIAALKATGGRPGPLTAMLVLGIPAVVCFSFRKRSVRFGLGVAALMLAGLIYPSPYGRVLHAERSFFGVHRIRIDPDQKFHLLFHGSTIHGAQSLDPARRREPLTYFSRTGPIGQVFEAFRRSQGPREVAVIGLGSGSMASYGRPGEHWIFYEIDPVVERIARDARYFTFLQDSAAASRVVLGDARLSLRQAADHVYGLIIFDAFSSDSVPVHLVTREALHLYLDKLAEGGILVFNISNRYLALRPVLDRLAQDSGLFEAGQAELQVSSAEEAGGKLSSRWVVMARRFEDLGELMHDHRWTAAPRRNAAPWTDDFSNILSAVMWKGRADEDPPIVSSDDRRMSVTASRR